jgi:DNA-binding CsgD family transcriptional regulator
MRAALDEQHHHHAHTPATRPESRPLRRPALSPREVEVLLRWLQCDSKNAVAADLYLSIGTVNTHLARIRAKYNQVGRSAPTKAALVARAVQDELISLDEL